MVVVKWYLFSGDSLRRSVFHNDAHFTGVHNLTVYKNSDSSSLSIQYHFPTPAMASAAAGLLGRQLKQMQTDKDIPGISCGLVDDNVFEWEVMLMISDEDRHYGGK